MKTKKFLSLILCLVLAGALCACKNGSGTSKNTSSTEKTAVNISDETIEDLLSETFEEPDTSGATVISLSNTEATVSGSGAKADGGSVTVTSGGTYIIKGTLSDGQITVNAPKEEVTLVLQNARITCSYQSAIYVYKSKSCMIYLPQSTQSTLSDGKNYTFTGEYDSSEDEEPDAALFSKSDLIIAGSGSLTINGTYKNGITSKDTLKINGSHVTVNAENNGINGKDYLVSSNSDITVTAGGDAVRSTNDSDSSLGFILTGDSHLELKCGEDGIQAETLLYMRDTSAEIVTANGSSGKISEDASAKGLKAGSEVRILSGEYTLNCCDDAIHSNKDVNISGGTYNISTGDDGVHADENTTVSGGTITVSRSYEGLEGKTVTVTGGNINITASDDGINAAGGSDGSGMKGGAFGGGPDSFAADGDCKIEISGGVININASGDGIDSNGSITVSGGELYISGPTSNGDGAIDCDGDAVITGGTVAAAGSSGMAENFNDGSTQGSILLNLGSTQSGEIVLKDESGNVLLRYSPVKSYQSVTLSCSGLKKGGTYTITAGSYETTVTLESLIYGSGMGGGTPGGNTAPGGNQGGAAGGNQGDRPEMPNGTAPSGGKNDRPQA